MRKTMNKIKYAKRENKLSHKVSRDKNKQEKPDFT